MKRGNKKRRALTSFCQSCRLFFIAGFGDFSVGMGAVAYGKPVADYIGDFFAGIQLAVATGKSAADGDNYLVVGCDADDNRDNCDAFY